MKVNVTLLQLSVTSGVSNTGVSGHSIILSCKTVRKIGGELSTIVIVIIAKSQLSTSITSQIWYVIWYVPGLIPGIILISPDELIWIFELLPLIIVKLTSAAKNEFPLIVSLLYILPIIPVVVQSISKNSSSLAIITFIGSVVAEDELFEPSGSFWSPEIIAVLV